MITDSLENANLYCALNENFKKAFEFLKIQNKPLGRIELEGDELYANIEEYQTKALEEGKLEAHKKYIDIQFIEEGEEKIGYVNLKNTSSIVPYNPLKDVKFLKTTDEICFLTLKKGDFVIFYPQDAHMPQLRVETSKKVKKTVVKIKI